MGEIADMMIGGDLCEMCGSALEGEGYGIPRYCSNECARDRGYDGIQSDGAGTFKKTKKSKGVTSQCFSVKIHYNGQSLFPDSKNNFVFHSMPKEKAQELAEKIREILNDAQDSPSEESSRANDV